MKKALLVVGMHRSGTSALAGALSILGVDVGQDLLPARTGENDLGFFELKQVHSFHEHLLLSGGRTWDTPSPLTSSWLDRFATKSVKRELAGILQRNFTRLRTLGREGPQALPAAADVARGSVGSGHRHGRNSHRSQTRSRGRLPGARETASLATSRAPCGSTTIWPPSVIVAACAGRF